LGSPRNAPSCDHSLKLGDCISGSRLERKADRNLEPSQTSVHAQRKDRVYRVLVCRHVLAHQLDVLHATFTSDRACLKYKLQNLPNGTGPNQGVVVGAPHHAHLLPHVVADTDGQCHELHSQRDLFMAVDMVFTEVPVVGRN
jgi:hypothetical protein